MKNYTIGLLMCMYADVCMLNQGREQIAVLSDHSANVVGNGHEVFLEREQTSERFMWFSDEFADVIDKHGVTMEDSEYVAILLPINLQEALVIREFHTERSSAVLTVTLKDNTECLLGYNVLVLPRCKLQAFKHMLATVSSAYVLLPSDKEDNLTPSDAITDNTYYGVWTTCSPLYWSNIMSKFMYYWLNNAANVNSLVVYDMSVSAFHFNGEGVTRVMSSGVDDVFITWSASPRDGMTDWELAAESIPDVVTIEIPSHYISECCDLHDTANTHIKRFKYLKDTCLLVDDSFIVTSKDAVQCVLRFLKISADVYITCTKAEGRFIQASQFDATYWFLASPRNLEKDSDAPNLQRAVKYGEYDKIYNAMCAIDQDLPAQLDVILKQL